MRGASSLQVSLTKKIFLFFTEWYSFFLLWAYFFLFLFFFYQGLFSALDFSVSKDFSISKELLRVNF